MNSPGLLPLAINHQSCIYIAILCMGSEQVLDYKKIARIASEVAVANLSQRNFTSIESSSTADSTGEEALRIVIVIPPGAESRIQGDATLSTLVQMRERLRDAGEERFPIIEYSTERELSESGDS
jgi:hypothetical protein